MIYASLVGFLASFLSRCDMLLVASCMFHCSCIISVLCPSMADAFVGRPAIAKILGLRLGVGPLRWRTGMACVTHFDDGIIGRVRFLLGRTMYARRESTMQSILTVTRNSRSNWTSVHDAHNDVIM